MPTPTIVRELLDRRVPQYVGLYVAGSWGFVQFVDWVVGHYLLSPDLINFVIVLLLLFLPTASVVAWRHGAPGEDRWQRFDAAAIGLNTVVAAAVLFGVFRGKELGATTTARLLEDAEGDTVRRVVPTAAARRSVLVFDFENETGDPDLDWLENGLTSALTLDLTQDIFMRGASLNDGSVRERLSEIGVSPDDDVPLALMRDVARFRGTDFFIDGTIESTGDGGDSLHIRTRLYDTGSGRLAESREYETADPQAVADRISRDLRKDVGIPPGHLEESADLPVAELSSRSPEAFRLITEARAAIYRENDGERAKELAERAIALDSTAAIAHFVLANISGRTGDQATLRSAVRAASEHAYRLPERLRFRLDMHRLVGVEGDIEGARRTARYWTELYPEDPRAHEAVAQVAESAGDFDARVGALRRILAVDSTDLEARRSLAGAFRERGRYDSAVAHLRAVRERRPDDLDARLDLAVTFELAGRFAEAREALDEAAAVAPREPDVPRRMAFVDLSTGDFGRAIEHLEETRALERTPREGERRAGLEEVIYYGLGRFSRLEQAYRERLALLTRIVPPSLLVIWSDGSPFLRFAAEAGRAADALVQIDSLKTTVEAPWTYYLDWPAAQIHVEARDLEAARSSLANLRKLTEAYGPATRQRARIAWLEGQIAALEDGSCRRALPHFERAAGLAPWRLFHFTLLQCLTALERWDDARREVDWLMAMEPGWPKYRLAVARYHAARGEPDEALEHLDFALDVWADADAAYRPAREARALRDSLAGPPGPNF